MKRPSLLALCFLSVWGLSGQSFDLNLATSSAYTQLATTSIQGSQSLALSLSTPLGSSWRLKGALSTAIVASYDGASKDLATALPWTLAGLDLPEFDLIYGSALADEGITRLSLTLGRFPYSDLTGSIYSYKLDGLNLSVLYPAMTLRFVLGYTGLLSSSLANSMPIIETPADLAYGSGDFAPPRVLAAFSARSPRIFNHDLYAAFTLHEDLRSPGQLIPEYETVLDSLGSGPASSAYLSAGLRGSPTPALSYSVFGILELGRSLSYVEDPSSPTGYLYEYRNIRAYCLGTQFNYALAPSLAAGFRVLYGSGDADAGSATDGNTSGDATQFVPVVASSSGLAFSPDPANLTQIELDLTFRPFPSNRFGFRSILAGSKTFIFVKNGIGPVSEAGILASAGAGLLGLEEDINASVQLLSDLSLFAALGCYLPMPGVYDDAYFKASPFQFSMSAGISIAL